MSEGDKELYQQLYSSINAGFVADPELESLEKYSAKALTNTLYVMETANKVADSLANK